MAAGLATLKYAVMPKIGAYQADILAGISEASGMDVRARTLRGGWSGFTPFIELEDVLFREPANGKSATRTAGATALSLPSVRAAVSIPFLLIGQVRLTELTVFAPQLSLIRAADGLIYFAGRPLNKKTDAPEDGRLLDWLISQPGIQINRASLMWRDDILGAGELRFDDVGIHIEKRFGSHHIGVTATPPGALAKKIDVSGRVKLSRARDAEGGLQVVGTLFANVPAANLIELRRHLNVPDNWQAGVGTVRAWIELDQNESATGAANTQPQWVSPVKAVTADVHITHARAQLGDDAAPLNIAKLAGRLEFVRHDNGFTLGSKKLELRTAEGVTSPPADFSFTHIAPDLPGRQRAVGQTAGQTAGGEITANGIDLKVMTSLMAYFPVGKQWRQRVSQIGLRGEVKASRYAWTGPFDKPTSMQVKGTLVDFGAISNEHFPGIAGFTGTIEGSNKGGVFTIDSKALTLDASSRLQAPLRFDTVTGRGKWQVTDTDVSVEIGQFQLANSDVAGEFSGKYSRPRAVNGVALSDEAAAGAIDINGTLSRANAKAVSKYFPNKMAPTRRYIEWATQGGTIDGADFVVKGRVYDFPFHHGKGGHFSVNAKLRDVDFRHTAGWPQVNKINGTLRFENTAMTAQIDRAQIFAANIHSTVVAVADFDAHPPLLTIAGAADARGEDLSRYLRESPLINTVGAFTKAVSIEGPGKLSLKMALPLEVNSATSGATSGTNKSVPNHAKFRISGKYILQRGTARPVVGPPIINLAGGISFDEAGVKSTGITGMAFGHPLTVNIAGGGEAGVVTDFAGRADVQQLGELLPFPLPRQISGVTDFAGRIAPQSGGLEIVVDSSMLGVTSLLPAPLGKRGDEARRLKLQFTAPGMPPEKIRVALMGNIAQGGTADAAGTRIDARLQRKFDAAGHAQFHGGVVSVGEPAAEGVIAEGLWLAGSLRELDFDQWQQAAAKFYPPVVPVAAQESHAAKPGFNNTNIAGIDFRLGGLVVYGRVFDEIKIKGRRTADGWAMAVASRAAEGDFTWRGAAHHARGEVRARLKRLVVADESPKHQPAAPAAITELGQREGILPALDIVADDFTFKDRWLGKLELTATPQIDNWKIDRLTLTNGHVRAEMNGIWQRYGDPFAPPSAGAVKSLTTMNIKLESNNLNALFTQFGHGDHMKGGRGGLEGTLSWPGHAYQFQLVNLSGAFKVNAERGQFAKIEAGAGKLLGLISLQSIPRRLTFDFRDLFSEGLAFDKIEGDLTIHDGIMFAKKFDITGPATDVKMTGDISLPNERQNLTVNVSPRLSGVAAVGTAVLVNPLVGLGVLLGGEVLRAPFERILSAQYSVTGTWDNPLVERIGKVVAPPVPILAPAPVDPSPLKKP